MLVPRNWKGVSLLAIALLRPKIAGITPDSNRGCGRLNAGRGTKIRGRSNSTSHCKASRNCPSHLPFPAALHPRCCCSERDLALFADRDRQSAATPEHHVVDSKLKTRSDPSIGPLITPDSSPDPPSSSPGAPMPTTTRRPHTPHGGREQAKHRHLHASIPSAGDLHDPVRHRHEQR